MTWNHLVGSFTPASRTKGKETILLCWIFGEKQIFQPCQLDWLFQPSRQSLSSNIGQNGRVYWLIWTNFFDKGGTTKIYSPVDPWFFHVSSSSFCFPCRGAQVAFQERENVKILNLGVILWSSSLAWSGNFRFYDREFVKIKFFGRNLVNFSPCVMRELWSQKCFDIVGQETSVLACSVTHCVIVKIQISQREIVIK